MSDRKIFSNLGMYVYAVAALAAGTINLIWRDFARGWQPIQAFGDHVPGRELYACITAVWLVAGGAALLWGRTARRGARALAIVYFIFAVFWLPRLYWAPHILGLRTSIIIGVLAGVGEQLILVCAAGILCAWLATPSPPCPSRAAVITRVVFGFCSVDFGLAHLTGLKSVAPLVPKWLPPGPDFWAIFTGIGFVLAGLAIISGVLDILASRLLTLMLIVFSALVLAPHILAAPRDHEAWGGNAFNLAAVGAAWIVADWLASFRKVVQQ
jgi:uncharacterized membrane protein YphA (DoxX/SURF4 family)